MNIATLNCVAQYAYDGFGRTLSTTGPLASIFRHRFSTKYLDDETGFYYYGYRYYAPELARWTTRDPIGEDGGLNLYSFCGNDGVNKIDPHGQKCSAVSEPHIKENATWELKKIKFNSISDSGATLLYGIYGYWRILGEVDCMCTRFWRLKPCKKTKDVYKEKSPDGKEDYSAIYPALPQTFILIQNPSALPLEIPFFTSIEEGFSAIIQNKLQEALQVLLTAIGSASQSDILQDIMSAIERDTPLPTDGTWPDDPCN